MKKIIQKNIIIFISRQVIYLMSLGECWNKWIHLFIYVLCTPAIQLQSTDSNGYYIFQKAPDHYSERESPRVRSLASIRYSSFIAHVHGKCSVNGKPLCASIPRGIDIHGKAVHEHGYTGVTTQRHWCSPIQSTRPFSTRDARTATGADSVFTGARNNSSPVLVLPYRPAISSQRELRHESPWERLFARRPRNSCRFSAFVVGHTWPKLDSATSCHSVADFTLFVPTNAKSGTNLDLSARRFPTRCAGGRSPIMNNFVTWDKSICVLFFHTEFSLSSYGRKSEKQHTSV